MGIIVGIIGLSVDLLIMLVKFLPSLDLYQNEFVFYLIVTTIGSTGIILTGIGYYYYLRDKSEIIPPKNKASHRCWKWIYAVWCVYCFWISVIFVMELVREKRNV
ncbi:MAG: hypothetical protein HWN65_09955 [Candidatus Helarchaeota archaeon]|nr:hypothetical protein [Candidatus Helarchaeota archaeon]